MKISLQGLTILILLLFLPLIGTQAQYFTVGNDPASLRWKQVNHNSFRLIYPKGSEALAFRYASLMATGAESIEASLQHKPRKYPLILHPYSAKSNGYTIWAPRRVELYPRPPIIGGAESYASHLLIHEARHMVQMDKLNVGVTKAFSVLLGEQATAAVIGLHLPSWFMEGDAVLTETLLSHSGRGRQALFSQGLRTMWLEDQVFSYDKAMFGSYKDYVPNHYVMGYNLVTMARLLGGPQLWPGVLDKMGRRPFTVQLLSRKLKKDIGFNKSELYHKTHDWLSDFWKNQPNVIRNSPAEIYTSESDDYTHYLRPIELGEGKYVALKTSLGRISEFILLDEEGNEEHITFPGYVDAASFDLSGNVLIWAEENPDIRWENRSYSNIYAYNIESGKKWQVSKKKRFFSPSLSPSGANIACIEFLPNGSSQIAVIDLMGNSIHPNIEPPEGESFQTPTWSSNEELWALTSNDLGKKLYTVKLGTNSASLVKDFAWKEIFDLTFFDDCLYFIGPMGSKNAIYRYDVNTTLTSLFSSASGGLNYLSSGASGLTVSNYTISGYKPAIIQWKDEYNALEVTEVADLNEPFIPLISRVKNEQALAHVQNPESFKTKKYRKFFHPFKFHSWAPVSIDLSNYNLKPGIMLMSQNDLSTVSGSMGIEYHRTFKRFEEFVNFELTGLGPIISTSFRTYRDQENLSLIQGDSTKTEVNYRNYQSSLNISYPLNFSKGRWIKGMRPAIQAAYVNYNGYTVEENKAYWRTHLQLGFSLHTHIYSRQSHRDLFPRLGFVSSVSTIAQAALFDGDGKTYISGAIRAYLPGILVNHSTRIYAGGFLRNEWMLPDQSPILLPRGLYSNFHEYNASVKFDYAFPFWYPDWNLGTIIYIKRFKANLFFDSAKSMIPEHDFYMTTGIDLTSDFYFLRIGAEIDAGARLLYNLSEQKFGAEIIFNFDLN